MTADTLRRLRATPVALERRIAEVPDAVVARRPAPTSYTILALDGRP